jgi:hypothetical protein
MLAPCAEVHHGARPVRIHNHAIAIDGRRGGGHYYSMSGRTAMARFNFGDGIGVGALAFLAFLGAEAARAAPQVLALIATDKPVPLACDAASCRVELPTLCLQPERRAPEAGRGYTLAEGQSVVLSGRVGDRTVSIPLGGEVRFVAKRTHVMVEARIARELIARHGLTAPAVSVGPAVSVVPDAEARDALPQTPGDIATAVGERRGIATALVDRDGERMPAVHLTNRLINVLPSDGEADPRRWRPAWASALDDARRDGLAEGTIERARYNVDHCAAEAETGRSPTLRRCLQGFNDDTMEYLNVDLESALKTGS